MILEELWREFEYSGALNSLFIEISWDSGVSTAGGSTGTSEALNSLFIEISWDVKVTGTGRVRVVIYLSILFSLRFLGTVVIRL